MRPQQLTLTNFGPFIAETIDFNQMTEAALFLICGKTGTGKTTIFDGMCYALFGKTSGGLRSGKEMRSMFASPEEETGVAFTFEHQDLLYQIERKPEQILKKKRGDGTRVQTAKVALTIKQPDGKELRQYTKQKEVDEQIHELLHLDAKQFSQIVLLPQGEFRTFLVANSGEKEAVLRHLFGTQIYQDFADQLKARLKDARKQQADSETRLDLLQQQFDWQEETPDYPWQEFMEEAQRQVVEQQAAVRENELQLIQLEKAQKVAEVHFYEAKELVIQFEKQAIATAEEEKLVLRQEEVGELRKRMTLLEWVDQQKNSLIKLDELTEKQASDQEKLTKVKQQINQINEAQATLTKELDLLAESLPAITAKQEECESLKRQIPLLKDLADLETQANQVAAKVVKFDTEQQGLIAEDQEITAQLQVNLAKQNTTGLQTELQELRLWEAQVVGLLDQESMTKNLVLALENGRQQQQEFQTAVTEALEKQAKLVEAYRLAKSRWAQLQIARLSLDLVPGEPCPVCGSLEHPQALVATHFTQAEIAEAENEVERLEVESNQLQQKLTEQETQLRIIREKNAADQEELEAKQKAFHLAFGDFQLQAEVTLGLHYETTAAYQEHLKQSQEQLQQQLTEAEAAAEVVKQLQTAQSVLQQQIDATKEAHNKALMEQSQLAGEMNSLRKQGVQGDVKTTEQAITELTVAIEAYQKHKVELDEAKTAMDQEEIRYNEQERQLSKELQETQEQLQHQTALFEERLAAGELTLEEYRGLLQSLSELPDLRKTIADYELAVQLNQKQLQELAEALQQKASPDIATIEVQYQESQATLKAFQSEFFQKKNHLEKNQQTLADFKKLYQQNQQALETFAQLTQLSNVISGDNPQKTSLERYILQAYLNEVLQVANQRLDRLTRGRYQFELSTEVGSYRNQTGLEINVYDDDAGSCRSAHTLSGGESFIAALALALSLAEVIQNQAGGISIEALFIDEGFGSLDEDALGMAMEALETIESEGRMIGIISHVRELKDRVPQKILVEGLGNGQSKISYQV